MNESLKVLNYTPCFVGVSTREKSVGLEGARDGVPTFEFFSMSEIEYINSQSPIFRNGGLEFEEEVKEEVYRKLNLPDWRERCLFERDVDDLLLNPTAERMRKIIDIVDLQTLERVRGHLNALVEAGRDVSMKVSELVKTRYHEISSGIRRSAMSVQPRAERTEQVTQEINALKEELAAMKASMAATVPEVKRATEVVKEAAPKAQVTSKKPVRKAPVKKKTE